MGAGAGAGALTDEDRVEVDDQLRQAAMTWGRQAVEEPWKAHTCLFVQLSLRCLRRVWTRGRGAAPGKLTDGDASQGPRTGSTVCQHDLLTHVYPASWCLCACRHTDTQAPWGGTVCEPDPSPMRERWAWPHPVSEHSHLRNMHSQGPKDTHGERDRCKNRNLHVHMEGHLQ